MSIIKKKQQYYLVKAKFDKTELKCLLEYIEKNITDHNIELKQSILSKCRILQKDLKNG